jgi:hypothetical protein
MFDVIQTIVKTFEGGLGPKTALKRFTDPQVKFVNYRAISVIELHPSSGNTKSHYKGQIMNYILSNSLLR